MKIHFVFRVLAVIVAVGGAMASVAARSAVSPPYVQYTSGVGAANPTCTVASGQCSEVLPGTACIVEVSRNGTVISSSYSARKAPSADPGPCGALNTNTSTVEAGDKNIVTSSAVILQ